MNNQGKIGYLLKALVLSYLVTGVILVFLAIGVWKLDFTEGAVNVGMIASYILSALAGGFYLGKKIKEKKFIWGVLLGVSYIVILLAATVAANGPFGLMNRNTLTTALICILSGMLGGMLG